MQNKFYKKDLVTEKIESIIANENKRRILQNFRESFNTSIMTECDRRILFKVMGATSEQDSSSSLFMEIDSQEATKNKWINFFNKSLKIKLIDKDVVVADCNYNVNGKIDGIIKIGDMVFVLLVKSISSKDFEHIAKGFNPPRRHVLETMIDMWLAELNDGIILYENKDTNEYSLYHVLPYQQIIEACKKKCLKLLESKMKGELLPRPYKSQEEKECLICEYRTKCWNNK